MARKLLQAPSQPSPSASDYDLDVVNSVWGERTVSWAEPFLNTLATSYGAGATFAICASPRSGRGRDDGQQSGGLGDPPAVLRGALETRHDRRAARVHFDVVVRVLGSFGSKAGSPRPDARVLEPYIPFVDETLSRYPRLVATRIQDMLVERGYEGSVRTLRRYVREAHPAPRNEMFLRVETLPGEQAQVDWAHVGSLPVAGGHRALWAFVMVLAYSRAMWAELVVDLGVDSLCRSLVRAVAFFGGCTRQWLFDNPKTVVLERAGDAIRFHPVLLDLAGRLHVQPRLCALRTAQAPRKGQSRAGDPLSQGTILRCAIVPLRAARKARSCS